VEQNVAELAQTNPNRVEVVAYDPRWPDMYAAERDRIMAASHGQLVAFEHIGSTAVPHQRAKPIIDMMAAVPSLQGIDSLIEALNTLGYQVVETGMRNRLFLRKRAAHHGQVFHLHVVEHATWDERNERLMRDYLQAHPDAVQAYGALKDQLAAMHSEDSLAYTKAKTSFIQGIMDHARAERGLPLVDVWED
jgi:GrpB-like predicted nucleotidyltransferase (UPF0157 family)